MTPLKVIIEGETVYLEVEPAFGSEKTTSASKTLERTKDAFEQAKTTVISIAKSMVSDLQKLDQKVTPDEFTLEFAIKFTAEGDAVVAKAGSEASLKVTMKYNHNKNG